MGRQNLIRRDEFPQMYQPPPPSTGLLLRFLAYAPLGMTNGIPTTPPVNGDPLPSWAPVAGAGPLVQAGAAPVYQRASAAVLAKVFLAATRTTAQAAIGVLPVGGAARTLILIGTGFTPGVVTGGQPLLRYGTIGGAGQDFGLGLSAILASTYVGRTQTAQQDNTTVLADNTKPALLVISYTPTGTLVKTVAVQDLAHMNQVVATRTLNTVVGSPLTLGSADALAFSVFEIMALDHAITDDEFDALLDYVQGMYGFGQN